MIINTPIIITNSETENCQDKVTCNVKGEQKNKKVKSKKKAKKSSFKFKCHYCKFYTNNRKDYKRHVSTKKHKKKEEMAPTVYTCVCGNYYKHMSGLSRHKKKCALFYKKKMIDMVNMYEKTHNDFIKKRHQKKGTTLFSETPDFENSTDEDSEPENEKIENDGEKDDDISLKEILLLQIKQQNDTIELLKQSIDTTKQMMPKIGNNNNNTISINVFLNEQCKNAMNLTDFIKKMNVSIEDLEYSRDNGFVEGVTNIFTKQLHDLKPTERPFHCTDSKRLQFYVKDDDKWEKDKNGEKIDKTIYNIKMKQAKKLSEWEKLHPNYTSDPKLLNEWQNILNSMTEDTSNDSGTKMKTALKRNMAEKINFKEAAVIKTDN
tara:strand:- start:33 stop:1163 length:1131 start_codon:yes stop_codon:yes gene_type:complete